MAEDIKKEAIPLTSKNSTSDAVYSFALGVLAYILLQNSKIEEFQSISVSIVLTVTSLSLFRSSREKQAQEKIKAIKQEHALALYQKEEYIS